MTSIGERAFYYCSALESLRIPDNVQAIGQNAFGKCDKLTLTAGAGTYAEKYCADNQLNYRNP